MAPEGAGGNQNFGTNRVVYRAVPCLTTPGGIRAAAVGLGRLDQLLDFSLRQVLTGT
jgi:hypothetical protein